MIRSRRGFFSVALTVLMLSGVSLAAPVIAQDAGPSEPKPFIWPTTGRITQPYGCTGFYLEPRYGSCRHFHGGIDIADRDDAPVRAAADGVVTHVGWDPWGTGNWMVMLNHGDGLTTWYAHMRGRKLDGISEGARVRQGDIIGFMSNTGMATGVHLHWAVLKDGQYADPRRYVDGAPFKPPKDARPRNAGCQDVWIAALPGVQTAEVSPGSDSAPDETCAA